MTSEVIPGYRVGTETTRTKNPVDKHRPSKTEADAHRALTREAVKRGSNCLDNPGPWVDIDSPEEIPSPEGAARMCAGCPVFDLCGEYVRLASPSFGVWAGKFRGEEIL